MTEQLDKYEETLRSEEGSITHKAMEAWHKYNPQEFLDLINDNDNELNRAQVIAVRNAFLDAFMMGAQYKVTGEITEQYNTGE